MGLETWKQRARSLRMEAHTLSLAIQDSRVPWYAKFFAVCVLAYALSPIDLIPDFIPVIGYLDDLVLVPVGIAITIRMIPPAVFEECKAKAQARAAGESRLGKVGAAIVIAIWTAVVIGISLYLKRRFHSK